MMLWVAYDLFSMSLRAEETNTAELSLAID
jgi:hypothetical protein